MSSELMILVGTAAWIGLFHTLIGPDHYLPFIVLARAGKWSATRTAVVTFLCGVGHVASSVVLGAIGIAFGVLVARLEMFEANRGEVAAWLLIGFGLAYFVWGIRRAILNKPHTHKHLHAAGISHDHEHSHGSDHVHVHHEQGKMNMTPWVLFIIFVFGPCEPLIPILMYPAATESWWGVVMVAGVFSITTIGTMLVVVLAATFGLKLVPSKGWERYSHAMAGAAICLSGLAIQFLGL